MTTNRRPATRSDWGLLLVALAVLSVANGRWHFAPAAWIAPVLLLLFVQSQPLRRGLTLAFAVQLVAFFINWRGMIPVPGIWYYVVAGTYAAVYFLPFILHRLVGSSFSGFRSTLVFPISWVAIEFLFQSFATPYGSWASLAYTQTAFLPLMQLASVTGIAGVHFLMTWSAAVAAWAWERRTPFSRIRSGLLATGAVIAAILAWGGWRTVSSPDDVDLLRVTGLTPSKTLTAAFYDEQQSIPRDSVSEASLGDLLEAADRLNAELLQRTRIEAEAGTDLIVWTEHAARVTRRTEALLLEQAREIAVSSGVQLILGIGLWDPESIPSFENKLVLIDAGGAISATYFKARPIVGQESGVIAQGAERIATVDTDRGRFAAVICHDLDFPDFVRQAGRSDAIVLVGPSSDWDAITPLHARMVIPRAIENGCTLIRPCASGLSLVVDPVGRVVASQLDRGVDGNVQRASVKLFRMRSLYPIIGDAFAYLNLVGLFLLLAGLLWRTLRDQSAVARSGA